jgi:prepilin-type N-terminal cleavage/methylation domain-containing protein
MTRPCTPSCPSPRILAVHRAFTLLEMAMSMVIVSILALACTSVVRLATRLGNPSVSTDPASLAVSARSAMDQINADLKMATSITSRSASSITFTVPDRNNDGLPETITYAWAGVGSPITRQYNGGAIVSIADNVQNFNLSFLDKTVVPPPPVESAEQVLASRDWPTASDIKSYSLKSAAWAAEYFKPVMPGNTVSWKVTRLKVKLQRNGAATGNVTVTVNNVDGSNKPAGAALGSFPIDITSVASNKFVWVDVPLAAISGLDPRSSLSIEVTTTNASTLGTLAYDQKAVDPSMGWMSGSSPGTTWSAPTSTTAMEYYVYGTVTTQP